MASKVDVENLLDLFRYYFESFLRKPILSEIFQQLRPECGTEILNRIASHSLETGDPPSASYLAEMFREGIDDDDRPWYGWPSLPRNEWGEPIEGFWPCEIDCEHSLASDLYELEDFYPEIFEDVKRHIHESFRLALEEFQMGSRKADEGNRPTAMRKRIVRKIIRSPKNLRVPEKQTALFRALDQAGVPVPERKNGIKTAFKYSDLRGGQLTGALQVLTRDLFPRKKQGQD